jgi:hypothetical protein
MEITSVKTSKQTSSAGPMRSNSRQPAQSANRKIIVAQNKEANNSEDSDGAEEEGQKKKGLQIISMIGEYTMEELKK